jgi:hypothetical protein
MAIDRENIANISVFTGFLHSDNEQMMAGAFKQFITHAIAKIKKYTNFR